MIKNILGQN